MKKRLLFIYNPNAGKGKIKNQLADILGVFTGTDYEVIVYATRGPLDAKRIVKEYAKEDACDRIVCSGGDGTLNEVAGGLMECGKDIPIGYIPAGTTNDFGYSLKLSKNMVQAAWCAVNGTLFPCDIGCLNGSYFTYTAAFGIFSDVSYDTPQTAKNVLGRMAYILSGIKRLYGVKHYRLRVCYDDVVIADEFIYGMIANSDSVGGFKGITGRDVQLDDGYFEMILIRTPQNLLELQEIVNALLTGQLNNAQIYSTRVNHVDIEAQEELPWSLDGEFGGNHKKIHIDIYKQAVRFLRDQFG